MEEKLKIATRQSYGEKLAELGEKNRKIVVLDADLSGATKTNIFAKKLNIYPFPPSYTILVGHIHLLKKDYTLKF